MKPQIKNTAKAIIKDSLLLFDTFYHMNTVLNIGNKTNTVFWSVEVNYKGFEKLFCLFQHTNEKLEAKAVEKWFKIACKLSEPREDRAKAIYKSFKRLYSGG